MIAEILITPISNIENNRIIKNDKVEKRICCNRTNIFTFFNVPLQKTRKDTLINVSLFDDLIVEKRIKYKILRMTSNSNNKDVTYV